MKKEDRRLVEESIPLTEISHASYNERNRGGHISAIHYWWARRPLVVSRAVFFGSLVKYPTNTRDKQDLLKQLVDILDWDNSNNQRIINKAREQILKDSNGHTPRVLDCFTGGGAIPLEALRLNCDTYALELNPVAHLIELATLAYPQKYRKQKKDVSLLKEKNNLAGDIYKWGKWVLHKTENEISHLYAKNNKPMVLAYLWARTVKCPNPNCGIVIPLIKSYFLSRKDKAIIKLKPLVDKKRKKIGFDIVEEKNHGQPNEGCIKRGTCMCPACNHSFSGSYIRDEFNRGNVKEQMTCVVSYDRKFGKIFKKPNDEDLDNYENTKKILKDLKNQEINNLPIIPNELLPAEGSLGISPYWSNSSDSQKTWADLYNSRQLVSISYFIKNIRNAYKEMIKSYDEDYAKVITLYLSFVLDKTADFNSTLCIWNNTGGRGVVHTFGRQALSMVWDYAETNPFNSHAASWIISLKSVVGTIENLQQIKMEPAKVSQGTAIEMPFENNFFDAIITDPPYYDSVPYSDLSDFFYVWLKRSVGDLFPKIFSTPLSPKTQEIIQNPGRFDKDVIKAKTFYEENMTKSFIEAYRVLKNEGIFVIVFAHKSTSVWETLLRSILKAGFIVSASWPIHTERKGRLRAQKSAALASSIFIVCRKSIKKNEGYFNDIKENLEKIVHEKLDEFWKQGIRGADFFISAIGPAVEVFGKYKKVRKLSGEEITVAEFLDLVRQIVTDYSLRKILRKGSLGDIDEITRFYVLWRWAYNHNDIIFDDARKLAQALGTEADQLIHKIDILQKKGDKVRLLGPKERENDKNLGEPKGGVLAPMIDVLHRACLLWEKGNRQKLTEFLEESEYKDNETMWSVAQNLSLLLPDGDKEKQLLQGLLASKSVAISDRFKPQKTLKLYMGGEK